MMINMKIGGEGVNQIHLYQDRVLWPVLVNKVLNLQVS
jgi:hypothetical protein